MASNAPPPLPPPLPAPLPAHTESNLELAIRKCIPKELIPETWQCGHMDHKDNVARLLVEGLKLLGMFESIDELYDTIFDFMDFPSSYEHFQMVRRDRVERFPYVAKSVKGKPCIYQNDIHKLFDHLHLCPYLPEISMFSEGILDDCWEVLRGNKHHKMIACSYEPAPPTFEEEDHKKLDEQISTTGFMNLKSDFKDMAAKTQGTIGGVIFTSMDKLTEQLKVGNLEVTTVVAWVGFVIGRVAKLIQESNIHLPPINVLLNPEGEPIKQVPVIRLFSIEKNHFVMVHELLKILEEHGVKPEVSEKLALIPENLRNQKLSTITFRDALGVLKEVGDEHLKEMEFAKMKSNLLMFNQRPIPTHDGGYCILAVDALYELLMDIVVAKKVFHTFEERDWLVILEFFKSMESHFDVSRDDFYFMDLKKVETIKKEWEKVYNEHLKSPSSFPRLVIVRDKDTFTMNTLDKELKRLKLDTCFGNDGNLMQYAYPIYLKLKEKSLSMSNLHLAIAQCQINALVRKVPKMLEFIKKQQACNRMNLVNLEIDEVTEGVAKLKTSDKTKKKNKKQGKK
ncbi:hypothetical protein CRE_11301 [Caenorhabditis remanei]|uniref:Uncharacterized protein n=1 Tax=Caenorhabditis remanei TaxID=31234 RepID=E3N0F9_CAERE|nr:hypothetical protein CRE_11301 [Caenorhabditis remanei]